MRALEIVGGLVIAGFIAVGVYRYLLFTMKRVETPTEQPNTKRRKRK